MREISLTFCVLYHGWRNDNMKQTIEERILDVLNEKSRNSYSMQEIAELLNLQRSKEFKMLVQTVAKLEREKKIQLTKTGKIKAVSQQNYLEGTFRANERGFGFVTIDPEEADIYISKENTAFAMDGDTVLIKITKPSLSFEERGAEGKVIEIKEHHTQSIVGEYSAFENEKILSKSYYGQVIPKDKKLANLHLMIEKKGIQPVNGSVVKVTITKYPQPNDPQKIEGIVTHIVGHKDDPGMDILSVVVAKGIPNKFSEEALLEAENLPETINPKDFPKRHDLRGQKIVTIDGADAKDLDDAVTVQKLTNGNFFLGVHIADVSYYVKENSLLDKEAFERGTSVYLTDRVISMIPKRLSNGICSLNPHTPRLTMSCEMEIDLHGQVVSYDIFPSIIESTERMTYQAVNQILEDKDPETCDRYEGLVSMFEEMRELHQLLEDMRKKRGAVSFEDKEAQIVVDDDGHPTDILLRTRGIGEKMIESFMLAANETVAKHFNQKKLPFLYRIHEEPKEEKLKTFFDFASALGILVKQEKGSIKPIELQRVLIEASERPEAMVINMMLLRSMQQAKYSEENVGHYGLAAQYYTHFTSPIRRYPDLIVHRLIRSYQEDHSEKNQAKWKEQLEEIAVHSSQMERRAVETEREVDAMKKAEFMVDHIDEEFEGVISSVVKFGLFVELPNTIEGLVHISSMTQDYYHYYENQLALIGEHTHQIFKIGQKVRVKVIKADPNTREVDFELKESENTTFAKKKLTKGKKKAKKHSSQKKRETEKKSTSHKKKGHNKNYAKKRVKRKRKKADRNKR